MHPNLAKRIKSLRRQAVVSMKRGDDQQETRIVRLILARRKGGGERGEKRKRDKSNLGINERMIHESRLVKFCI